MTTSATRINFKETGSFTPIALDYLAQAASIKPFIAHSPDKAGMEQSILSRKKHQPDRALLVSVLKEQYEGIQTHDAVSRNIGALESGSAFTITTAHQNNIFLGPLYFIYKILHVIRLAEEMNKTVADAHFVPVYWMGSEDADLDELDHIRLSGETLRWDTKQQGAVGRMVSDEPLAHMLSQIAGQLEVFPQGPALITLLEQCYRPGNPIQQATFELVNALMGSYGLLILIPDHPRLKASMHHIFRDDLLTQSAASIVEESANELSLHYKVQAHPRQINLFYLLDGVRARIEREGEEWSVLGTDVRFGREQLLQELQEHPERFSPNVILRGLYQETILPNIAFVGGGGELAYWLELKKLFAFFQVPFPLLMLRNSFMLFDDRAAKRASGLGYSLPDLFRPAAELLNEVVQKQTSHRLDVESGLQELEKTYAGLREQAAGIDPTLGRHVDALKVRSLQRVSELGKKMLRAEKRRFMDQSRQITQLKEQYFPGGGLQERSDSFLGYYARWGQDFIHQLYQHSPALDQSFILVTMPGA